MARLCLTEVTHPAVVPETLSPTAEFDVATHRPYITEGRGCGQNCGGGELRILHPANGRRLGAPDRHEQKGSGTCRAILTQAGYGTRTLKVDDGTGGGFTSPPCRRAARSC